MNRSQLINILSKKTGLDKKDVKRTIDEMQKLIVQEVKEGQRICLHGFGSFNHVFNPVVLHETRKAEQPYNCLPGLSSISNALPICWS